MVALLLAGIVIGGMFIGTANANITTNVNHTWSHIKRKADPYYGTTGYQRSSAITIATGEVLYGESICPGLTYPTGGGAFTSATNMSIEASYPIDSDPTSNAAGFEGWGVYVRNDSGGAGTFTVYAVCQYAADLDANYTSGTIAR
ncbi:MAG TPA: hypothetical protein VGB51_06325 [Actinomycetota bacterium]